MMEFLANAREATSLSSSLLVVLLNLIGAYSACQALRGRGWVRFVWTVFMLFMGWIWILGVLFDEEIDELRGRRRNDR